MITKPKFPNYDGLSSSRLNRLDSRAPDAKDWDQVVAELVIMQEDIIDQFRLYEVQIQFIDEPYSANVLEVEILLEVTDSKGIRNIFSLINEVTVNITGGTATGKELVGGGVVTLVKGQGKLIVKATSTGKITLDLTDSAGSGLDISNTALITLS